MPALVRLYIQSVALGFAIAVAFTGGLLWLDVAGIGHLVLGSDIGWIAAVMLVVFNGIVFSAVQFAFRVMGMAEDDRGPKGGHGAREPVLEPLPVAVRVHAKR
jgi:TRAP-type C4-dicarboxylate transport system permease small subunit